MIPTIPLGYEISSEYGNPSWAGLPASQLLYPIGWRLGPSLMSSYRLQRRVINNYYLRKPRPSCQCIPLFEVPCRIVHSMISRSHRKLPGLAGMDIAVPAQATILHEPRSSWTACCTC